MNWEQAKLTNLKATLLAEAGDIRAAIKAYIGGGCYSYSPKERRKLIKSQINSKPGKRKSGRRLVDAKIFYTAYRRFFLPTFNKEPPKKKYKEIP